MSDIGGVTGAWIIELCGRIEIMELFGLIEMKEVCGRTEIIELCGLLASRNKEL